MPPAYMPPRKQCFTRLWGEAILKKHSKVKRTLKSHTTSYHWNHLDEAYFHDTAKTFADKVCHSLKIRDLCASLSFFKKLFDDSPFTVGGFQCLLTHIQHGNREIWRLWAALSLASLQVIWFQDWRSCSGFLREISVQASELFGRYIKLQQRSEIPDIKSVKETEACKGTLP